MHHFLPRKCYWQSISYNWELHWNSKSNCFNRGRYDRFMYNALVGYSLFADMHWWTLQRDLTIQNKPLIKLLVLHPTVKVILGVYYLFSIPLSSLATTPTTKSFHSKVFQFKCFLFQIDEMMRLSISDERDVNFKAWDWSFVTNRKLQMIPIDNWHLN